MSRARRPSAAELELWRRAMRDTQPLVAHPDAPAAPPMPAASPAPPAPAPVAPPPTTASQLVTRPPGPALDPHRPIGLDRQSWLRLKRGRMPIDGTLDLHGCTQAAAHAALARFLAEAARAGLRCVLVVTGKGGLDGGRGILRHMVPRWLHEPEQLARVLAYLPAQPRHGGAGALYILLRRSRPPG